MMLPPDSHVHSEWLWDAYAANMRQTCAAALHAGIPQVMFTDQVDFVTWELGPDTTPKSTLTAIHALSWPLPFDRAGYRRNIEICRGEFPDLIVRTGVEIGDPHLFADRAANFLARFERDHVLASLHSVRVDERLEYVLSALVRDRPDDLPTAPRRADPNDPAWRAFRRPSPRRYPLHGWAATGRPFDPELFADHYREMLAELAVGGRALELNGRIPESASWLAVWWAEPGGTTITFGSDTHQPSGIGRNFTLLTEASATAGFRATPAGIWHRPRTSSTHR